MWARSSARPPEAEGQRIKRQRGSGQAAFGECKGGFLVNGWTGSRSMGLYISSVHGGPGSGCSPLRREDGTRKEGARVTYTFALLFYSVCNKIDWLELNNIKGLDSGKYKRNQVFTTLTNTIHTVLICANCARSDA